MLSLAVAADLMWAAGVMLPVVAGDDRDWPTIDGQAGDELFIESRSERWQWRQERMRK